jgi:hypothetical protein
LKYPEGTACAEVLKAAVSKESIAVADKTHTTANAEIVNQEAASGGGKVIFTGFGIDLLTKPRWSRSESKRPLCGSTRLDSVFYNLSSSVSRGP